MFKDYSARARQGVRLARHKAEMRGPETVEIEDLRVAFLIEDQGESLDTLSGVPCVGIDTSSLPAPHQPFLPHDLADDLLAKMKALRSRSKSLASKSVVSLSEGVKRAFVMADLWHVALQRNEIAPMHLLAATLKTESGAATPVFREVGIMRGSLLQALRGQTAK